MIKWINKKRNKKGFTLVELVVVIAILGILAAIAVPKLSASRENAAIAAHNANVRTLESSATLAVSEGSKAITWAGKDGVGDKEDGGESKFPGGKGWVNYLQSWPDVSSSVVGKTPEGGETITATDGYTVEIGENGTIIVKPGKIVIP